jgi:AcrR family transcriptional regulator
MTPEERIIHAALGLIAERGTTGVSMSSIATAAGVARQTLYNHFPTIDAIVMAALDHHERETTAHLERVVAGSDDPATQLEFLVRSGISIAGHSVSILGLVAGLGPDARDRLDQHRSAHRQAIASILQAGVERGRFRTDLDIDATAGLIQTVVLTAPAHGAGRTADAARSLIEIGVAAPQPASDA